MPHEFATLTGKARAKRTWNPDLEVGSLPPVGLRRVQKIGVSPPAEHFTNHGRGTPGKRGDKLSYRA